jgi:hypothetical protein
MSALKLSHNDLKEFDKRVGIESTKVKNLASGFEKVKKAIEADKKVYSADLKKAVDTFAENQNLAPEFKKIVADYSVKLDRIQGVYDEATMHIQDVSCNALGFLPKKFENHKKTIKLSEKAPDSIHKLKDFEYDRIMYT